MNKFPTQKELLTLHRQVLDEKYKAKYPNGKFVLQKRDDMGITWSYWCMHWEPKRPTGATSFHAISVKLERDKLTQHKYRNNSFGKVYNYDTLEKLLAACEKRLVPAELVEAFSQRYQNRHTEGF